jgi:signal transduction histidine kinase
MGTRERDVITHGIEHELTLRLERASDLSERAKLANDAAQHEIDRALQIADELRDVSRESASRAERLRGSQRDAVK